MRRVSLDLAQWMVRAVGDLSAVPVAVRGREVPAQVPGCVYLDLLRVGLIPDPLVGFNEREVQWIGETDFEYRASFEADPELLAHERVDLVCEGLDTIAEVRVNGVEVGRAANMFHPHRFDLRGAVRAGANEVSITFRSALKHIRAEEKRLGARPVNGDWDPYIFIRKAACSFGWDWAPKLAGCGIWKSIALEGWNGVRLRGVQRIHTHWDTDAGWTLDVIPAFEWSDRPPDKAFVRASLRRSEDFSKDDPWRSWEVVPGTSGGELRLMCEDVERWWPRGLGTGKQPLYPLDIVLGPNDGPWDHVWSMNVGFREVRLLTQPDENGSRFALEVNGREVFCKGANWIPEGPWAGRVSREMYEARLRQAAAANMNMLRVWGGGYYESDAFYDLCDELGIMVWQDFMFACAMYPEEEPIRSQVEAEARHQVSRLSSHPSVVLWCGGNECVWAHDAWGNAPGERPWKERLQGKTWGAGYYFDLLPRVVGELAPGTPYWANSPWAGSLQSEISNLKSQIGKTGVEREAAALPANSADDGDRHTWDQRGDGYRKVVPRFCSEFGQQSPSNYATLARVLPPGDLKIGSAGLDHRQRGTGGTARHIDEAMLEVFRAPRDFDEWHYLAQLTQARAMRTGIEWMRVNRPRCMGTLIWQLNDCWPGMSWSLVDSEGREKLAYFAAQQAFRSRLISIQPFDGRPWLCVVNDDEEPARYIVELRRMSFDGAVHRATTIEARCAGRSAARTHDLFGLLGLPLDPTRELLVADTIGRRATWYFGPDRELGYKVPEFSLRIREHGHFHQVIAVPNTLVRDFARRPQPGKGHQGWGVVTILPGEEYCAEVLDVQRGDELPVEPLRMKPFLCANYFGAGS